MKRNPTRLLSVTAIIAGSNLASCTFSTLDRTGCSSDAECQAAFGAGNVCVDDGFCERVEIPPRCRHPYPEDLFEPGRHGDTILFGSMMDFSLATQRGRVNAIKLAAKGANDFDGLQSRRFGLVFCDVREDGENQSAEYDDNLTQAEAARSSAGFLVDALHVPVVIGPSASTDTINTFTETVKDSGTLQITPSGTSEALTGLESGSWDDETPGLLWRTTPPDTILGAAKAKNLLDRQVRDIVIVGVTGYGTTLGRTVQDAFLSGGGDSATLIAYDNANDTDRQQKIIAAASEHPDAEEFIFVSSNTADMVAFMQIATTSAYYEGKSIFLGVAAANSDFINNAPGAFFGPFEVAGGEPEYRFRTVRYAAPQGSVYNNFLSLYAGTYQGEDASGFSFVAQAYDAGWLAIYGATWSFYRGAGRITGLGVARGLRKISSGREIVVDPSTWPEVRSLFEAGISFDAQGASGDLDYDPATEETTGPVEILVVESDPVTQARTFRVVETMTPQ